MKFEVTNTKGRLIKGLKKTRAITLVMTVGLAMTACGPSESRVGTMDYNVPTGVVNGSKVTSSDPLAKGVVAIVSITAEGESLCTGSLIAKDLILTAAHCVDGNPEQLIAIFAHDVRNSRPEDRREVDSFKQHPGWGKNAKHGKGDMAILHLNQEAPAGYAPVDLISGKFDPTPNRLTTMLGYGVTSGTDREGAGILREMQTHILGNLTATEVRTDGKTSSVCFGDSGGPAFVRDGSKWMVWGVASSVSNQACTDTAIHTRVDAYLKWIASTSKKLRKS